MMKSLFILQAGSKRFCRFSMVGNHCCDPRQIDAYTERGSRGQVCDSRSVVTNLPSRPSLCLQATAILVLEGAFQLPNT
jgi:hypothetical protein